MIDADAGVALERVPPIVPEGVDPLIRMQMPDRVSPALSDELAILLASVGREQSVLRPAFRLVDVDVCRDDVVVADQDRGQLAVEQALRMRLQRVEPGELVIEL